jgi:Zn-finger nucleic acid-binding protein
MSLKMPRDRCCPRCDKPLQSSLFRMAQIDRCLSCSLVFLDSMELNFLTGRNIEQAFFQDPRIVTHCAHCREVLHSASHCDDLQRLRCSSCTRILYQANVVIRVRASANADDPYRGSEQVRGRPHYEHLTYRLEVCVHCQSLLLQTTLFDQILALFSR